MSALEAAKQAVYQARWVDAFGPKGKIATDEVIAKAVLDAVRGPILALHTQTCEINGDRGCEHGDACPVLVCGPCGEKWPCPTVKALQ